MKKLVMRTSLSLLLFLGACRGDSGRELMETARFEEKQHNREHAVQLYEEVVRRYPGSDNARAAEARLMELKKQNP